MRREKMLGLYRTYVITKNAKHQADSNVLLKILDTMPQVAKDDVLLFSFLSNVAYVVY